MYRIGPRLVPKQHHGLSRLTRRLHDSHAGISARKTQSRDPVRTEPASLYEEFPHRAGTRQEALEYLQSYDFHFLRRCESRIDAISGRLRQAEDFLARFTKPIEILPGRRFITADTFRKNAAIFAKRSEEAREALKEMREYYKDMQFKPYPDRRREQIDELGAFEKLDGQSKKDKIEDLRRQESAAINRIEDSLKEWADKTSSEVSVTRQESPWAPATKFISLRDLKFSGSRGTPKIRRVTRLPPAKPTLVGRRRALRTNLTFRRLRDDCVRRPVTPSRWR